MKKFREQDAVGAASIAFTISAKDDVTLGVDSMKSAPICMFCQCAYAHWSTSRKEQQGKTVIGYPKFISRYFRPEIGPSSVELYLFRVLLLVGWLGGSRSPIFVILTYYFVTSSYYRM